MWCIVLQYFALFSNIWHFWWNRSKDKNCPRKGRHPRIKFSFGYCPNYPSRGNLGNFFTRVLFWESFQSSILHSTLHFSSQSFQPTFHLSKYSKHGQFWKQIIRAIISPPNLNATQARWSEADVHQSNCKSPPTDLCHQLKALWRSLKADLSLCLCHQCSDLDQKSENLPCSTTRESMLMVPAKRGEKGLPLKMPAEWNNWAGYWHKQKLWEFVVDYALVDCCAPKLSSLRAGIASRCKLQLELGELNTIPWNHPAGLTSNFDYQVGTLGRYDGLENLINHFEKWRNFPLTWKQ